VAQWTQKSGAYRQCVNPQQINQTPAKIHGEISFGSSALVDDGKARLYESGI